MTLMVGFEILVSKSGLTRLFPNHQSTIFELKASIPFRNSRKFLFSAPFKDHLQSKKRALVKPIFYCLNITNLLDNYYVITHNNYG